MSSLDQRALQETRLRYGLAGLSAPERIERGVLSDNHALSDGTARYILKKWRINKPSRIEEVLAAEKHFATHDVPVILPLPTEDGRSFIEIDGSHYSLYPYVEGTHIERQDLKDGGIAEMASMLARMHEAGQNNPPAVRKLGWPRAEKAVEILETAQAMLGSMAIKSEFDTLAEEYIEIKLGRIRHDSTRINTYDLEWDTLIHGDYHESNIFFDGGAVSHVFDFEKTEIAPRSLELARCVRLTFLDGEYGGGNSSRGASFVTAYAKAFPISADEVRRGIYAWFNRGIYTTWIIEEHYLKNNTRPDVFLENELRALRFESDHLEEIADALTAGLT